MSALKRLDPSSGFVRRLPVGAEVQPDGAVHFRVWAPTSERVWVQLSAEEDFTSVEHEVALAAEDGGYFSGRVAEARAGLHYKYRLDRGAFPDPATRFQPTGPHGASRIVDPSTFEWCDHDWRGVAAEQRIIYEMHIGTFTREGTWAAATAQLELLAELGVTLLEVMPVADFPGRYGWGYDGVNLFAPTRLYGEPDGMRAFVDRAHALGMGVILDVVYNHLGPDANYLKEFSPDYFSTRHHTDWGEALNFDAEASGPVRELFIANAGYWIDEFHLDGLRLDATQQIYDDGKDHILAAIARRVREAGGERITYLVAENEPQHTRLVRPAERGGYGLDALWNDDFHHSAIVALSGRNEAYYMDYQGSPQEFISAAKWGYLYQGQRYKWQKARRGTPALDLAPGNFVTFIQNHDQVANSLWGHRIHTLTSSGRLRAATALLLLGPGTPMLFQGQEFAASTPFLYFADHNPELAKLVASGRAEFLRQFPSIASLPPEEVAVNPEAERTFQRCKLDPADRDRHREVYDLHRDLIALRKSDSVIGHNFRVDGAVLGNAAFVLRFFGGDAGERLLIVNLEQGRVLNPAPEPLLAPPEGQRWALVWSSEDPRYGGSGTPPLESDEENWRIPAQATVLLAAQNSPSQWPRKN